MAGCGRDVREGREPHRGVSVLVPCLRPRHTRTASAPWSLSHGPVPSRPARPHELDQTLGLQNGDISPRRRFRDAPSLRVLDRADVASRSNCLQKPALPKSGSRTRFGAFTVISSWKLLARFRQHFSAPPRLQCRREERELACERRRRPFGRSHRCRDFALTLRDRGS